MKCYHEPLGETETSSTPPGLQAATRALRRGKSQSQFGNGHQEGHPFSSSLSPYLHTLSAVPLGAERRGLFSLQKHVLRFSPGPARTWPRSRASSLRQRHHHVPWQKGPCGPKESVRVRAGTATTSPRHPPALFHVNILRAARE